MSLHLQPRDIAILTELGEYGILDTAVIHRRHWPADATIRACQQRLKILSDAGLIKRASLIVAYQAGKTTAKKSGASLVGGSIPTAFWLTQHGADLLERETGHRPRRVSRSDPAAATLLHRIETVEARLAIDDASKNSGLRIPAWIMEQDTYPNVTLSDPLEKRHVLYERFTVGKDQHVSCRPDASCLLHIPRPGHPDVTDPLIIYWEIDRSKSSPQVERDKAAGYHALVQTKTYAKHWPATAAMSPYVRIFYVCPSTERIAFITTEVRSLAIAKDYRFAVRSDVVTDRVLTEQIWQDIDGKRYSIVRRNL